MLFKRNLANLITSFRLAGAFVLFVFWQKEFSAWWLFGLMTVVAVSDFFDGRVARITKTTSSLGAHLDRAADKIVALVFFIILACELLPLCRKTNGLLPWILAVVGSLVVLNETIIVINSWRFLKRRKKCPLRAGKEGKWKMALYFVAMVVWFFGLAIEGPVPEITLLATVSIFAAGLFFGVLSARYYWRLCQPRA